MIAMLTLVACRKDVEGFLPETVQVGTQEVIVQPDDEREEGSEAGFKSIQGFYLLNEGNMGSNKATLDYYDYATGTYTRNIYGNANPNVPKEMGDVGNALAIYGERLYAVINCANKIEGMDRRPD